MSFRLMTSQDLEKITSWIEDDYSKDPEHYKYFYIGYADFSDKSSKVSWLNGWSNVSYVLEKNNELIGFIRGSIKQPENHVQSLSFVSFEKPHASKTFFNSTLKVFDRYFKFHNFSKINFVAYGPIQKKLYRKLVNTYGGRVVGVYKKDVILITGEWADCECYEIMKEEWKYENSSV